MIFIMAIGMMISSMGSFASHGTNGLTGNDVDIHDVLKASDAFGHSHDSNAQRMGHSGHNAADHFHETPEPPPSVEISFTPVAESWRVLEDTRSPVKSTDIIYRPPSLRVI
ncbi:hypothetical protein ACRARH_13555 [Phytobacter ursingii]|jgi:hypothetical protein|nr:hypothetical protein [Citrobacter sp.]MDU7742761.1 hypothetical protein [Citrobacter sp.]